jgi:dTDP-4-amino-4,6-dideoxygalactose transaminase
MKIPFGDLGRHYRLIKSEIDVAVFRVLESGWFVLGKELKEFEKKFASFAHSTHALGVGSGTEAIQLALVASGVQPGDEVITVPNTAVPTLSAISFSNAKPVFVDINPQTFCMDVEQVESKITLKTKAIVPVHLYGHPCEMDEIMELAQKHNLKVIEDCAQSHGSTFKEQTTGTFGDFGAFSFYPSKNLGAFGDAGLVTTQNQASALQIEYLRNYGQTERYYHKVKGFNSRLDEMQAAILSTKLEFLAKWTERRREIATLFNNHINNEIVTLPVESEFAKHVYHLYVIRTQKRDELRAYLSEHGIGTQIHYPVPCHLQQAYKELGHKIGDFPITEKYANQVLSLPNYPELTDDKVLYICDKINQFKN